RETISISGESGAGKSLLLRAIADLIPHQGQCFFNEQEVNTVAPNQWRRQVAYLASESQWWFDSIGEHFDLPLSENTVAYLENMGFSMDTLKWDVMRCSTGERQRLGIIRVLANKPDVLLLDEPTANLDASNSLQVEKLFLQYQQQTHCSIVWVAHNKEQIQRVAQRQFEISQSELIEVQV
ncbi:Probable iron export ATP-binding protein FetA, partial [hydrothermal vent metagenome]